jgi:hypothetical protein
MRNVIATLFQVAALALIALGLWLLEPFSLPVPLSPAVGWFLATDRPT